MNQYPKFASDFQSLEKRGDLKLPQLRKNLINLFQLLKKNAYLCDMKTILSTLVIIFFLGSCSMSRVSNTKVSNTNEDVVYQCHYITLEDGDSLLVTCGRDSLGAWTVCDTSLVIPR